MTLVDLITDEVIKVPLYSTLKMETIRELIDLLVEAKKIADSDAVYEAIMNREAKGSTGLENGIAVPHAKTDAAQSLTLALGVSRQGIDFGAIDGKPSHLFFLLLAPSDQSGPHIEALSEIARLTRSKAFCRTLMDATTPGQIVELIKGED